MQVNPLPPQAYTKDTLQKAYSWLLAQPASVKEMAQDQNMLVSLYLKAQRNGDASLEAPSIQNFKQELKSLASMMGDFQSPQQLVNAGSLHMPAPSAHAQQNHVPIQPTSYAQTAQASTSAYATSVTSTTTHMGTMVNQSRIQTMDLNNAGFDQKTLEAIHQVRETFNLSSDTEAIRVLVAVGIKQLRKSGL